MARSESVSRSRQLVTLPADVMKAVHRITSDPDMFPEDRFSAVLLLVYGWAWFVQQHRIDPTMIALPRAQWDEVASALTFGVPGDRVAQVNLGLRWMDRGPAGYDD